MERKNIVFIGYPLDIELNCVYEKRIALWKSRYDELSCYEKVVDLGDILSKLFGEKENRSLELELCDKIMSLIDNNTIAIIDTAFSAHGLFEGSEELYNQLKEHLEKIKNKEIKFFLCEPLRWMGKIRYKLIYEEYDRLVKIMNNRVFLYKDNEDIKVSNLEKHLMNFFKYICDNI